MKLSVGLLNSTLYWDVLLNQIGVAVKKITVNDPLLNKYPVIILNDIEADQKNHINKYLSNGGCIIAEAGSAKNTFNIPNKRKKIDFLYTQVDDLFSPSFFCSITSTVRIPIGANYLESDDGTNTVLIKKVNQGILVVLPDNFLQLIFSGSTKRKIFYSRWGKEFPTEKVSRVDKNGIYNILFRILEYLFHKKDLPFVRLWQFPNGNENIFGFRIDTDFADDEDIKNLYTVINKNEIQATWFIETLSREKNIKLFNHFDNQEIALHCYQHKTYKDEASILNDIGQGVKVLNDNGIFAAGYASPFGEWNEALCNAIEKSRFIYSSEFGFAFDSLPMYSQINNAIMSSIQIPIHPVSAGRLNIAGHTNDEMVKYYSDIINQKLKAYEPIIFYTHPSQKRFDIFDNIFKIIKELKISSLTFNDLALWWKKREAIKWDPEIKENEVSINTEEVSQSVYINTSFNNGKNYLAPITAKDLISRKEIIPRHLELLPGFHPGLLEKKSIKILKQEIIYNYRKLKN